MWSDLIIESLPLASVRKMERWIQRLKGVNGGLKQGDNGGLKQGDSGEKDKNMVNFWENLKVNPVVKEA